MLVNVNRDACVLKSYLDDDIAFIETFEVESIELFTLWA